jgi:licheninase
MPSSYSPGAAWPLAVLFVAAVALTGIACSENLHQPEPPPTSDPPKETQPAEDTWPDAYEWVQVWGDEFDYTGQPNASKWTFETGGDGWGNQELQYYTDRRENARVDGEHLIIEARRESFDDREYTSARLNSTQSWTYGRYEIRARVPAARGTWSALWMLAENNVYGNAYWPDNGEIDIMEHVGYETDVVHATVHTEAYNHIQNTQRGEQTSLPSATDAFHVYAVEWTPTEIRAYVDGTRYFTFPNERRTSDSAGYAEWPFDRPFFLLMNVAVGGTWGGQQGVDAQAFPQQMEVDYVRVYQPGFKVESNRRK